MIKAKGQRVWVAVRVERGFVSDIRVFREKESAFRQERYWRRRMNPDYDETGVAGVIVSGAKTHERSRCGSPKGSAPT